MLYPLPPVMVSCGTMEKSNIITVAWTGTVNSEPPMTYVSVRPERHSYAMIKERGEFVINLTTERLVRAADLCGVRSGRDVQKFRFCRLTPAPASAVSAPLIAESPVNIECRVEQRLALGSHDMFRRCRRSSARRKGRSPSGARGPRRIRPRALPRAGARARQIRIFRSEKTGGEKINA